MKIELEVNGQTIHALSEEEWKRDDYPRVIDLRRADEVDPGLAAEMKEADKVYLRVPISPETLSEQDLDRLRWEFARRKGPYAVISTQGVRAAALVLMHAARTQKWDLDKVFKECPAVKKDKGLEAFVTGYLERHSARSAG